MARSRELILRFGLAECPHISTLRGATHRVVVCFQSGAVSRSAVASDRKVGTWYDFIITAFSRSES